jgi:hypothetical protein
MVECSRSAACKRPLLIFPLLVFDPARRPRRQPEALLLVARVRFHKSALRMGGLGLWRQGAWLQALPKP